MKRKILSVILVLLILAIPSIAFASDVTEAKYLAKIQVSENGTAATSNTATVFTGDLTQHMNATRTDASLEYSGSPVAFMPPSPGSSTWNVFVGSIGLTQTLEYDLYLQGATGGKVRYFPDEDGMTTPDDASIELSDNFTIEQKGFVNLPDAPATRNLLDFERGNADLVTVPDDVALEFTDGAGNDEPFTIIVWVNFEDATSSQMVSKVEDAGTREYEFTTAGADTVALNLYKSDGSKQIGRLAPAITAYEGELIHLAATYDGSEASAGINIYLNGQDVDNVDQEVLPYAGMTGTASQLRLGARYAIPQQLLDGLLAEVKIYTAELTPTQIFEDYIGLHLAIDLEAWYELDEGTGNPEDSSGNGHNATANLADWVTGTAPEELGVLVAKAGAFDTTIDSDGDITSRINGGNTVTAIGVTAGERIVKTTSHADALDFTVGNSDWVSIPDSPDFEFTDGAGNDEPFSILGWVNLDTNVNGAIITKDTSAGNKREWQFEHLLGSGLRLLLTNTDQTRYIGRSDGTLLPVDTWQHVAATYDGSETSAGIKLYISGVQVDSADVEALPYVGMTAGTSVVQIGSYDGGLGHFWDGLISELVVYDVELSLAEVLADYNGTFKDTDLVAWYQIDEGAGNPTDSTANGHDATANLADWVTTGPFAIYIDDELKDIASGASVPNNANNWAFLQNSAMLYMESHEIIVGGTQAQFIEWEYAATFTDQSVNTNTATPTFRTASNNLNVTATLASVSPVTEAKVTTFSLGSLTDILTTTPDAIPQMYTEGDYSKIPLGPGINAMLDAGEVPRALWWHYFLFGIICIVMLMAYGATARRVYQGKIMDVGDQGSLLLMSFVGMGGLAIIGIMGPIPFWPAILFPIPAAAIMMSVKHRTYG